MTKTLARRVWTIAEYTGQGIILGASFAFFLYVPVYFLSGRAGSLDYYIAATVAYCAGFVCAKMNEKESRHSIADSERL